MGRYARHVEKPGVALADVKGFPKAAADRLRERASVTTAEEFVDLARRMAPSLERMLDVDGPGLRRLRAMAEEVAEPVEHNDAIYQTGMDLPPNGQDAY